MSSASYSCRSLSQILRDENGGDHYGFVCIARPGQIDDNKYRYGVTVEEFLSREENFGGTWLIDGGWGGPPGPVRVDWLASESRWQCRGYSAECCDPFLPTPDKPTTAIPPAMATTLYALTGDALRLQAQIDEAAADLFSDDPAVVAAATATLEGLIAVEADNKQALLQKADAWCWVIDRLRATAAARKARAQALRDLATEDEQQADKLEERLIQALLKITPGETRFNLPEHKISSRKSTAVVVDCEPEELPAGCQRTTIEADKPKIKEAITAGIAEAVEAAEDEEAKAKAAAAALVETVPGCTLVERRSWSIK